MPVNFDHSAELLGYDLQTTAIEPGEEVRIATLWRAIRPLEDAILFTHLQGSDGIPIAQDDRLDVPSYGWETGDMFIQLHTFRIPIDTPVGEYPIVIGLCQRSSSGCSRLGIVASDTPRDILRLTTLSITQ